tara:strand:- start:7973 stop:8845 length:873 start_codon:yes stop_codon:yes gene_type:complete
MKNFLLTFLSLVFIPFLSFSQCVPDTVFTGLVGVADDAYVLEDTTGLNMGETIVDPTALPNAIVGDAYETFFNMRIPTDTVIEYDLGSGPQLFDPVYINTIGVNEIQGLPMGFSYECASQNSDGAITDMNCIFPGGGYGCLRLFSDEVPNVVGTYPLVVALDIVAEYEVFGIMIPVEVTDDSLLNYLVLIVEEGDNSGVGELVDAREFKSLGTYPNPFNKSTTIHFGNNNSENVKFSVYDILGNLIQTENINSNIGHNEFIFEKGNLTSGLYTYSISNGVKTITERIVIH